MLHMMPVFELVHERIGGQGMVERTEARKRFPVISEA